MSAGYIKELLLEYGMNGLSIEDRSMIAASIESLILADVITRRDILYLHDYLAGYKQEEIALKYSTTTQHVIATLSRIILAISVVSGYTDAAFIKNLETTVYAKRTNTAIQFFNYVYK